MKLSTAALWLMSLSLTSAQYLNVSSSSENSFIYGGSSSGVSTETEILDSTTLVTITSCSSNACSETVSTALVSIATVTSLGVVTKYTTWCPLTTTESIAVHSTTESTGELSVITSGTSSAALTSSPASEHSPLESSTLSFQSSSATRSKTGSSTTGSNNETTTIAAASTFETLQPSTTLLTVTSCSADQCFQTEITSGVIVVTETHENIVTTYTTYCPLTTESSTFAIPIATTDSKGSTIVTAPSSSAVIKSIATPAVVTTTNSQGSSVVSTPPSVTTVAPVSSIDTTSPQSRTLLTVTSCSEDKCSTTAVTTGVTVITETHDNIITTYTTYCPLTTESSTPAIPVTTIDRKGSAIVTAPSSSAVIKSIATPAVVTTTNSQGSSVVSTPPSVTTVALVSSIGTTSPQSRTLLTVTSCSEDKCSTTAVTTGVTVITETHDNIITTYITYCPLTPAESDSTLPVTATNSRGSTVVSKPSSTGVTATPAVTTTSVGTTNSNGSTLVSTPPPASASSSSSFPTVHPKASTSLVTFTSCSNNECSTTAVTTGVIVVTETHDNKVTSFTTYCPLTDEVTGVTDATGATLLTSDTPIPSTTVTSGTVIVTPSTQSSTSTLKPKSETSAQQNTLVAVSSCDGDQCSTTTITTGVSVVAKTHGSEVNSYTTYGPSTDETTGTTEAIGENTAPTTVAATTDTRTVVTITPSVSSVTSKEDTTQATDALITTQETIATSSTGFTDSLSATEGVVSETQTVSSKITTVITSGSSKYTEVYTATVATKVTVATSGSPVAGNTVPVQSPPAPSSIFSLSTYDGAGFDFKRGHGIWAAVVLLVLGSL